MEQKKLDRINELARKVKNGIPLTEEETAERDMLRREYLAEWRASVTATLENTYIQYPDGTKKKVERKK